MVLAELATLLRAHGWSEAVVFALSFHLTHQAVVWSSTVLFALVDHWNLLSGWKIQRGAFPPFELYRRAFLEQLKNALVNPVILWTVYTYGLDGRVRMTGPLDSWILFLAKSVAVFLWLDFAFYWEHRLVHHPALYSKIHKQHHLFKQSVAVAYEFASVPEGLFVNGLPLFVAFYFANFHLSQLCLFLAIRITETVDAHCGYDLPFSPWRYLSGAVAHDLHHSNNLGNFGLFHFWDYICGTRTSDLRKKAAAK